MLWRHSYVGHCLRKGQNSERSGRSNMDKQRLGGRIFFTYDLDKAQGGMGLLVLHSDEGRELDGRQIVKHSDAFWHSSICETGDGERLVSGKEGIEFPHGCIVPLRCSKSQLVSLSHVCSRVEHGLKYICCAFGKEKVNLIFIP